MIDRNDPYFWSDWLDTILKGAGESTEPVAQCVDLSFVRVWRDH